MSDGNGYGRRFEGRAALITGGASGIGRATAERVVAEGGRVVLLDLSADGLAATVEALGGEAFARGVPGDVTAEAEVAAAVAEALDGFGRLDLGVNCAGIGGLAPIDVHPTDEFDRVVAVNLKGTFLAVKHEAAAMKAAGAGGVIVNIASLNGRQAAEGMVAYCAAKAAVVMLTQVAALELGRHGIRVVGIGPGLVDTPLTAGLSAMPTVRDAYVANTPLGRAGTPEEVAAAACWLASDEAGWASGDTLYLDGAAHTREYPRFFDLLGMA